MADITDTEALEHAWRYFELHAAQRMQAFNYFLVIAGLALSGIGGCLASASIRPVGMFIGATLAMTAAVFYLIDKRTSFLIKHSEGCIVKLEEKVPPAGRVFTTEPAKTTASKIPTYGTSFTAAFTAFAVVGLLGAASCWWTSHP